MPVLDQKHSSYNAEAAMGSKYIVLLVQKPGSHANEHGVYVWDLAGQEAGHKLNTHVDSLRIESMRGNWLVLCETHKSRSAAYVYSLRKQMEPIFIKEKCHTFDVVYHNDIGPVIHGITIIHGRIERQSWEVKSFCLIKKDTVTENLTHRVGTIAHSRSKVLTENTGTIWNMNDADKQCMVVYNLQETPQYSAIRLGSGSSVLCPRQNHIIQTDRQYWRVTSFDETELSYTPHTSTLCYLGVALDRFWVGSTDSGTFFVSDTTSGTNSFSIEEHKGGECAMSDYGLVCAAGDTLWVYHMNAVATAEY
ncbi:hypothetical protein THASP1DRAFT_33434 [Thamnocephalis sphaerospora]|uniref:Uncharacterized protein n=1 Tax=Thamnocephalis sphaerospora TaxID=78915 RepID=A0A4P9XGL7_9FUNG|nr:hypothetical protein THASP1DRAFT_33434 [Thamnocephalis sphaerospora]|eukprot:RKP04762.1 hypothetical protein THASP1DRAFT_33434 [Thamnocephalis sphaerospora]